MFYFKYAVADWVKQYGLPQHHLRIVAHRVTTDGTQCFRWYYIFDTTLQRGFADYSWILASTLESNSELVEHTNDALSAHNILMLCERLRYLPYSIPKRQDCESLQRYIQAGDEAQRWSPQVRGWGLAAGVVLAFWLFGAGDSPFAV